MNRLKKILSFILLLFQIPQAYIWYVIIYTLKMDSYIIKATDGGSYSLVFDKNSFFKSFFGEHLPLLALLAAIFFLSLIITKMSKNNALPLIYALLCVILMLLLEERSETYRLAEYTLIKGHLASPSFSLIKYILLGIQTAVSGALFILNSLKKHN